MDRRTIEFDFTDRVGTFFIIMMSVLSKRESKFNFSGEDNKLIVERNDTDEVIKFDFDLEAMKS